ncbi:MAG TPA: hypothetical protein VLB80_05060 [Candidatus Babeliales bacterium]|nr:hypothetical protein [Candidatus Babeliales bacterium]
MTNSHKKILLLIILLGCAGSAFGYTWKFTNATSKWLVIQVILAGINYNRENHQGVYLAVVGPGRNTEFAFESSFSPTKQAPFSNILIATYDKNFGGIDPTNRILLPTALQVFKSMAEDTKKDGGQDKLLKHSLKEISIKWIPNIAWDTFNKKIQEALPKLIGGTDSLEKAIGEGAENILSPSGFVVQSFMEFIFHSKNADRVGRTFIIIDDKSAGLLLAAKKKE